MIERRKIPRQRTYLGGIVEFRDQSTLNCVIRDLSVLGARLICNENGHLPTNVVLEISKREQRICAQIIWQSENEVGLSFDPGVGANILPFKLRGRAI